MAAVVPSGYSLLLFVVLQVMLQVRPQQLIQGEQQRTLSLDERLLVTGQRFLDRATLLVFLQFSGDVTGDMLSVALGTLAIGRQSMVLRADVTHPAVATLATTLAHGSTADETGVALIVLLAELEHHRSLRQLLQAFPVTQKLLCPGEADLSTAGHLLEELWRETRVIRLAILWPACPDQPALMYDPFLAPGRNSRGTSAGNSSESWGAVMLVREGLAGTPHQRPLPIDAEWFGWRQLNLHRMPIELYGFEAPMANRRRDLDMLRHTIPGTASSSSSSFLDLRCTTPATAPDYLADLFGADVEALAELARRMNFQPRVRHEPANFGFRTANGTFTGVLGSLMAGRGNSWMSLNVYFLKDYETRAVQFTAAVYQDSLCVFVKAAGMLPDWLLIFRCFTPPLWLAIVGTVAVAAACYAAITRVTGGHGGTRAPGVMVSAMVNAPVERLGGTTGRQKVLIGLALLWGLTLSGAFQGSLVDVYTTPRSRRNLDTLAELDASGLPIVVSAPALAVDVFGNEDASSASSTIANLRHRLVLAPTISSRASGPSLVVVGQSAALIRKQDFGRLSTKYLGRDGTPRVHRLRECPRSYTLAYLYPRGSPLYAAANQHILHFLQHGLYARWQSDAGHLLALNRALKVRRLPQRAGGRVALGLQHLLLPFLLLAAGHTLAAVCLLWEQRSRRRRLLMLQRGASALSEFAFLRWMVTCEWV
ncbi:uncharacterized protein LOC126579713 [Anopheles aquasalis]|uniref:uncharacterized protein LOC126579713 n=1 Tax=Anopheles aquasalis TaxID=42839 RepID=UPI00215A72A2|nr:uncharacterized protein LOC126579713 [Anopheles aquasalis]